jgi:hypothetical protein
MSKEQGRRSSSKKPDNSAPKEREKSHRGGHSNRGRKNRGRGGRRDNSPRPKGIKRRHSEDNRSPRGTPEKRSKNGHSDAKVSAEPMKTDYPVSTIKVPAGAEELTAQVKTCLNENNLPAPLQLALKDLYRGLNRWHRLKQDRTILLECAKPLPEAKANASSNASSSSKEIKKNPNAQYIDREFDEEKLPKRYILPAIQPVINKKEWLSYDAWLAQEIELENTRNIMQDYRLNSFIRIMNTAIVDLESKMQELQNDSFKQWADNQTLTFGTPAEDVPNLQPLGIAQKPSIEKQGAVQLEWNSLIGKLINLASKISALYLEEMRKEVKEDAIQKAKRKDQDSSTSSGRKPSESQKPSSNNNQGK